MFLRSGLERGGVGLQYIDPSESATGSWEQFLGHPGESELILYISEADRAVEALILSGQPG